MNKKLGLLLLLSCTLLGGCASLPLLSFGASSISYAVSGKSLSDHVISRVMKKDCALHRPLLGEDACMDGVESGTLRAQKIQPSQQQQAVASRDSQWQLSLPPVNKPLPSNQDQITTVRTNPDQSVLKLMAEQGVLPEIGVVKPGVEFSLVEDLKPQLFAVVGSFNQLKYARHNLRQHKNARAQIITTSAAELATGATRYRVVIGPLSAEQFNHRLGDLEQGFGYHAWRLRLCSASLAPPPCPHSGFSVASLSK